MEGGFDMELALASGFVASGFAVARRVPHLAVVLIAVGMLGAMASTG